MCLPLFFIVYSLLALVDADLNQITGKDGWDYAIKVSLGNKTEIRKFYEIFSDGVWKERSNLQSNKAFNPKDKTIDVYLRLNEINSPDRIRAAFYSNNFGNIENDTVQINDLTDWIVTPVFKIGISADQNDLEFPAGESRTVQWNINSSSHLQASFALFLNDRPLSNENFDYAGTVSFCTNDLNADENTESLNNSSLFSGSGFPFLATWVNEFGSRKISGFHVNVPSGLVDFSSHETYYKVLKIYSLGNATPGLHF